MRRVLPLILVAVLTGPAVAADPPFVVPQIVLARIDPDDKNFLQWDEFKRSQTVREIEVPVQENGQTVLRKATVTTSEFVKEKHAVPVKNFKALRGGKAIPAEKLAEMLAEEAPVVFYTGVMPEKYKKLFAEDAILIEFEIPTVPAPKQ